MADVEFEPHEAEWWVEAGLERERWERERREGRDGRKGGESFGEGGGSEVEGGGGRREGFPWLLWALWALVSDVCQMGSGQALWSGGSDLSCEITKPKSRCSNSWSLESICGFHTAGTD